VKFSSLEDFAERGLALAAEQAKKAGEKAKEEVAKRTLAYAVGLAPVGGKVSPDRNPGRLKASLKRVTEYGQGKVVSDSPYGGIINRGRKRGITPKGQKRVRSSEKTKPHAEAKILGSPLAPQGISTPVLKRLNSEREEILRSAIEQTEREG
jgi:hypothetical protein